MRLFLRNNGLSLVLLPLFFLGFLTGQTLTGRKEHNSEQQEHGAPPLSLAEYVKSSHFIEATMENWESEFLQMFIYVTLTAFMFQKGSAESKDPDKKEKVDQDPRTVRITKETPWPVKKGGIILRLYENSLSLAFLILFGISFALHVWGGVKEYNNEREAHGQSKVTLTQFLGSSRLWFESFQNWQSEFLAIGSMVVLSIWLRQRGSPESKPVAAPHSQTGE